MKFVNKEDHFATAILHFANHALKTLFKLASVFGTGNEGAHIKAENSFVSENLWNIFTGNTKSQAFSDSRFPHTRFTDQDRIVFLASCKHLDGAPDFFVTPNDWVQVPTHRKFGQITGVLFEDLILGIGVFGLDSRSTSQLHIGFMKLVVIETKRLINFTEFFIFHFQRTNDKVLSGNGQRFKKITHPHGGIAKDFNKEMFWLNRRVLRQLRSTGGGLHGFFCWDCHFFYIIHNILKTVYFMTLYP